VIVQGSEQLSLKREREVADFIEEERPVMRLLEETRLGRMGVCECSPFVAEQLALHESCRDGGTVDGDKRTVLAWTTAVQGLGEEFFAGPSLPVNQHGHIAVLGNPASGVDYLEQLGALALQGAEGIGISRGTCPCAAQDGIGAGREGSSQEVEVIREGEVIRCPSPERFDGETM
jgi:hypothetical protein